MCENTHRLKVKYFTKQFFNENAVIIDIKFISLIKKYIQIFIKTPLSILAYKVSFFNNLEAWVKHN